jgi:hypothetical protein
MFNDNGTKMTLCGILKKISESTDDEKIQGMLKEATKIAKKIDLRLKHYSRWCRRSGQYPDMES